MSGSIHVHIRHKIFLVRQCPMSVAYLQPCTKTCLDATCLDATVASRKWLPIGCQKGDLVQTSNSRLSLIESQFKQPLCQFSTVLDRGGHFVFIVSSMYYDCLASTGFNPSRPNPRRREKIKLHFYFHTSLWCLKRFYEGHKGLHKTFKGTSKKCENKNVT